MFRGFASILVLALTGMLLGCGSNSIAKTSFTGDTTVSVVSESTANDQLSQFYLTLESLQLTDKAGHTVQLLPTPVYPEMIHVNGNPEPLATVSIPQGVYTSATISLISPEMACLGVGNNGMNLVDFFLTSSGSSSPSTVTLPQPLTISGATMELALDLQVSQSAIIDSCQQGSAESGTPTPTFVLTTVDVNDPPTSAANGKFSGLEGIVASVSGSGSSCVVDSADGSNYGGGYYGPPGPNAANGPVWTVSTNSSTACQGIGNASQITPGMAVDMDAELQPDGSLLAARVAVYDPAGNDTSLWVGVLLAMSNTLTAQYGQTTAYYFGRDELGPVLAGNAVPLEFGNAAFGISGQFSNLANLPFPASFTKANMVAGQNMAVTFHDASAPGLPALLQPASVTLLPQTIDGTVNAIGTDGSFTTYTVTLAPYDTFLILANQTDQTTQLTAPATVIVYADSNTQKLNTDPVAVGTIVRFSGLVLNDKGTLRMDCSQIENGVAE